jgi:ATP-dependent helicase/nuclease subunit B
VNEPEVRRVFWGWERPVLESAVEWLTDDWEAGTALDLSATLVVVPTAEAGRRLRRSLAEWADERGGAVSVPHVWPPQVALSPIEDAGVAASDLEVRLAWVGALQRMAPGSMKALLPKMPEERSWRWCWDLAETVAELQQLLGAGGLGLADALVKAEAGGVVEAGRWRDLVQLETVYEAGLAKLGKRDPQGLKKERALQPRVPEGVRRVVVLAAPDLPPLMADWLGACAGLGLEVTVAIQAPAELADGFDAIGRPRPASWGEDAEVDAGLEAGEIHLCREAVEQAERVVGLLGGAAEQGLPVAVGVCDAEVGAFLREKLVAQGLAVFEPGGVPVQQDGLWHLLSLLGEVVGSGNWKAFCGLMRIAEVRDVWGGGGGGGGLELVKVLDAFSAEHLPGSLELAEELLEEHAADWVAVRQAVRAAGEWRRRFETDDLVETARAWLIALYGERGFRPEAPGDRERTQLAWAWLEVLQEVARSLAGFGLKPDRQEGWALVMRRLSDRALEAARGEVDLVLQGWLELLWERAPALMVAGMNEENVPGIVLSHPFLPDRFREQLGLPCQATRFARDAYLLKALVSQRRNGGRVGMVLGQWSEKGDARRPSRLLTLCGRDALPERVRQLFPEQEEGEGAADAAKTLAWLLEPECREVVLESISASRMRSYLECPFRFYLRHVLRMEPAGGEGREMDARQFGSLVHEVLRRYAQDEEARCWKDVARIGEWFEACARQLARERYGRRQPPLVRLQLDAAVQRLRAQAEVEAAERLAGWEIVAAELSLGGKEDDAPAFLIEGVRYVGTVDRIERHSGTGERRVLDFKTADKAADPKAEHGQLRKAAGAGEAWKTFPAGKDGQVWRWVDLQLPLYAAAMRGHALGPVQQAGYGCLPKGVMETGIRMWEGFDESWEAAALACAAEVVRRIQAGVFWPPNEGKVKSQDFDPLFLEGVMRGVRWR